MRQGVSLCILFVLRDFEYANGVFVFGGLFLMLYVNLSRYMRHWKRGSEEKGVSQGRIDLSYDFLVQIEYRPPLLVYE